jgi:hypothetical protein
MPVAFATSVLQFVVQVPQWAESVRRFVSQPELAVVQCPNPVAQAHVHAEVTQLGVEFWVLHAVPQPPQLRMSFVVSMHRPWQHCLPPEQSIPASTLQPATHWPDGLH